MGAIKVEELAVELVSVDQLELYPGNARRGNLTKVRQSIDEHGFYTAIVRQKSTGYVIVGNHRLMAAQEMKIPRVPVITIDVDDDRARRILLADNKISDDATYDTDALVDLLGQFDIDDLDGTGWDPEEVEKLITPPPIDVEDDEPETGQIGDLEFRIVVDCRDETHQADLLRNFEAEGLTCRPLLS